MTIAFNLPTATATPITRGTPTYGTGFDGVSNLPARSAFKRWYNRTALIGSIRSAADRG
ncbi:MAG: hypothetical protein ABJH07_20005 [Sedimentitalea sp.]|uniref:hypothetical protein n=1 Tax=Sedimentitalea sp. TaxID=2048915 RepID=UPI00326633B0